MSMITMAMPNVVVNSKLPQAILLLKEAVSCDVMRMPEPNVIAIMSGYNKGVEEWTEYSLTEMAEKVVRENAFELIENMIAEMKGY